MKKIRPQIQSKLITYKLPGDPTAMGKAKLGRQFQLNPVGEWYWEVVTLSQKEPKYN